MGTRNLTIVVNDNRPVIAQYGQWDGYPAGQGLTILNTLKSPYFDVYTLKEKLKLCRFINESVLYQKAHDKFLKSIGAIGDYFNGEQAKKYFEKYPFLSRDHGGDIIGMVHDYDTDRYYHELIMLKNSYEFAADSLFCEWAYVVDLDLMTFEVYHGFIKKPLTPNERFYPLQKNLGDNPEYYPIKHLITYKLSDIKNLDKETFLECEKLAYPDDNYFP